ncbi:hypothetical protein [Inquilinus sp.]|jgi:hypothetical protein|uniref:hypothetical protein n=1 Tax=Inquilinus sp. TaxID=1932117 RepID=UPI00378392F0
MSFGAIAIHPSSFTLDATDGGAAIAGALVRSWREGGAAADPFLAAHAAWKAASEVHTAAESRMSEREEAAVAKYGIDALWAKVQIGINRSNGEPRFAFSDDQIDALIADRIKGFQAVASKGGTVVSTENGLVPLADVIQRLHAKGEKMRAELKADEQRVAALRAEFGIDVESAAVKQATDALGIAEGALYACPATTPAGIALKLATLAECFGWAEGEVAPDFERSAFAGILADLQRLGGRN